MRIGIWKSVVKTTESYPFDIDTNHLENYEAPSEEDEGADPEDIYCANNLCVRKTRQDCYMVPNVALQWLF